MDTTISDQANNNQASHPSKQAVPTPDMTEAAQQTHTTISDHTNNSQASHPLSGRRQPVPDIIEAAQQAHTTTTISDHANNRQASSPLRGWIIPYTPMEWEAREARLKQYWEDKELADLTARNTKFNKNIK